MTSGFKGLLHDLMLNRMSLSIKNSWYDEQGRVYIYCTAEETREDLRCGNDKALKLLAELDVKKGFGLIERIKQRQGRPTKRYALNISPPGRSRNRLPSRSSEVQTSTFPASRPRKNRCLDLDESDALTSEKPTQVILNPIKRILFILIHPSIHSPPYRPADG